MVWKPVHGGEFWPPTNIMLSVSAGTGVQLCMALVSLVLVCLGFLSLYGNCEALLITVLVLNVLLGMVARCVSTQICKRTGLLQWKNNVLIIAFLYPGIVFCLTSS